MKSNVDRRADKRTNRKSSRPARGQVLAVALVLAACLPGCDIEKELAERTQALRDRIPGMKLIRYDGVILVLTVPEVGFTGRRRDWLQADYAVEILEPVSRERQLFTMAAIVPQDGCGRVLQSALLEAEWLDLQPIVLRRELGAPGGYRSDTENLAEFNQDFWIRHHWRDRGYYPIILLKTPGSLPWTDEHLATLREDESVRFETSEERESAWTSTVTVPPAP